jgi:hypothetical protein
MKSLVMGVLVEFFKIVALELKAAWKRREKARSKKRAAAEAAKEKAAVDKARKLAEDAEMARARKLDEIARDKEPPRPLDPNPFGGDP